MEKKYIETVLAQIREKRAREYVRREVGAHLEDQKAAYIAAGMPEEQAEAKAVADMGDPVETGTALNLIHKPKPAWGMLAVIALLCAAGVILQYTVRLSGTADQAGGYFFRNQCKYAVAGFIVLCGIYLMDYTRIAKYSRQLCTGVLLFIFLAELNGFTQIRGTAYLTVSVPFPDTRMYIFLGTLLYLYVPLYAAMLYSFRGCQKRDLWKILLYTILPVYLSLQISYLSVTLNLTVILLVLLAAAIVKGWFKPVSGRLRFPSVCLIAAGLLAAFAGCICSLKEYQTTRIRAWLIPGYEPNGNGYIYTVIRNILRGSQLIGKNNAQPADGFLPDYPSDFILAYLIGEFGVLAAAALIILVILLGVKLLRISIHQKNQLGMIMGLGCSLVFGFQAAEYILVNLTLLPVTGIYFPLVSFGGSGMMQTCILLGILLSIYRYENIVTEPDSRRSANVQP